MNSQPKILIISERLEANVPMLEEIFRSRGVPYARFNTEDFPLQAGIALKGVNGSIEGTLSLPDQTINLSDIKTIWNRRRGEPQMPENLSLQHSELIQAECKLTLNNFYSLLQGFWINDPRAQRLANNKIYQLKVAQKIGFDVPRTLLSNQFQGIHEFFLACGKNMIFKPLGAVIRGGNPSKKPDSTDAPSPYESVFTNVFKEEYLDDLKKSVPAPLLCQERVAKKIELRVTVVGRKIFPAEIHSQSAPKEETRLDWRRYDLDNTPHKPHAMPPLFEQRVIQFMDELNLNFGCLDFILTPEGRYVFLEVNPAGQYGWIEALVGFPLNDALADLLIQGHL